jgi:MarR family transcriptional regulator, organic hydroperoxide resistance regulator
VQAAASDDRFLASYLPFLLFRADTLLSRRFVTDLEQRGRSVGDWRILASLHGVDPLTIFELTDLVLFSQPSVSRLVIGLEAEGLVKRSGSKSDRRHTVVRITDAGARVAEELELLAHADLTTSLNVLDPVDAAHLRRILAELVGRLADS